MLSIITPLNRTSYADFTNHTIFPWWKQSLHYKFQQYITYLAEAVGIRVIEPEESYTSKGFFTDAEPKQMWHTTCFCDIR